MHLQLYIQAFCHLCNSTKMNRDVSFIAMSSYLAWLDSALSFVNSHLMVDPKNEICVVGVSKTTTQFLYPTPASADSRTASWTRSLDGQFEGFREVEATVREKALALIKSELGQQSLVIDSLVAGGLCTALAYINRSVLGKLTRNRKR